MSVFIDSFETSVEHFLCAKFWLPVIYADPVFSSSYPH